VTGPEIRAHRIARGQPNMAARLLAKKAGVRVEVARRILELEQARRAA
jgi:hypothetical protein